MDTGPFTVHAQDWNSSALKKWLNGEFRETAFSSAEQGLLVKCDDGSDPCGRAFFEGYRTSTGDGADIVEVASGAAVFILSIPEINYIYTGTPYGEWPVIGEDLSVPHERLPLERLTKNRARLR